MRRHQTSVATIIGAAVLPSWHRHAKQLRCSCHTSFDRSVDPVAQGDLRRLQIALLHRCKSFADQLLQPAVRLVFFLKCNAVCKRVGINLSATPLIDPLLQKHRIWVGVLHWIGRNRNLLLIAAHSLANGRSSELHSVLNVNLVVVEQRHHISPKTNPQQWHSPLP